MGSLASPADRGIGRWRLAAAGAAAGVTALTAAPLLASPVVSSPLAMLLAGATGLAVAAVETLLLARVLRRHGRPLPLALALAHALGIVPLALLLAGRPLPVGWLATSWRPHLLAGLVVLGAAGAWWARPGRRVGPAAFAGAATALTLAALALPVPDVFGAARLLPGLAWAAVLSLACVGWGELVRRALALPPLGWGLRGALGAAAAVVGGGLLDACWALSRPPLLAAIAAGVAAALAAALERSPRRRARILVAAARRAPLLVLLAAAAAALAVLHVAGAVAGTVDTVLETPAFDLHDDEQAYLLMPRKMLELGSLGPEPFEARRMLSLGGQPLLQTLVLVALPLRALHLVDAGVMLVLLVGLASGGARRVRLHPAAAAAVLLLMLALPHPAMRGNTSAVLTGAVLLLALYRLLADAPLSARPLAAAVPLGLVAAAACAVKSTFIPPVAAVLGGATMIGLLTASRTGGGLPRPWREPLLAGVLAPLACWPWMVSLYGSSATFLYPVLGRGLYGGVFTDDFAAVTADIPTATAALAPALTRRLLELLPLALLLPALRRDRTGAAAVCLAAAAVAGSVALVLLGDPELNRSLSRYAFPVNAAALAGVALAALPRRPGRETRGTLRRVLATAVLAVTLAAALPAARDTWSRLSRQAAAAAEGAPLVGTAELAAVRTLQAAVPAGRPLLATLRRPYLLDPARNPVLQMSLPGMSSLPPGLPVFGAAGAVADSLTGWDVDHLAYGGLAGPGELLRLSEQQIRDRYPSSHTRWVMLRGHAAWHRVVHDLALRTTRRYQDEQRILLQLDAPAATVVPGEHPHTGLSTGGWTSPTATVDPGPLPVPDGSTLLLLHTRGWHPWREQSERIAARVRLDGVALEPAGAAPEGFAFLWPPGRRALGRLDISAEPLDPAAVGARPGQRLGVDVGFLEVVPRLEGHESGTAALRQPSTVPLAPETVWRRSGFHADNNWTDGHGVLRGLAAPVPAGHDRLLVRLHPIHPWRAEPDRLDLRVLVNGIELAPLGTDGDTFAFRLAAGQTLLERVDLLSRTFVPAELGPSGDRRRLGAPVASVTTAPAGP